MAEPSPNVQLLVPANPDQARMPVHLYEVGRSGAYEQFMRDDSPEDAIYDSYR